MAAARVEQVKALRALARARGVNQVKDNASREKVLAMVADLRKQPLEGGERQKLEEAMSAYLTSFPDCRPPAGAGDGPSEGSEG